MAHTHDHPAAGRRLGLSAVLTLAFVAGEAVAGALSNSLALLSDAAHNFADALALGLSWYAARVARRPADARRTYGYHRAGVLAALVNAASLVVIALFIVWEAVGRLRNPEPVASGPMIGVALAAIAVNVVISLWLRAGARHDLNVRSAYLHMVGDALAAAGVVAAGVVVLLTGESAADPAVSLLIGVMILWSSRGVLGESVGVLMEGAPQGLDTGQVAGTVAGVEGVLGVHHLHVWTVASGLVACSCHVRVAADRTLADAVRVRAAVAGVLEQYHGISHTTVQIETEDCAPGDLAVPWNRRTSCTITTAAND